MKKEFEKRDAELRRHMMHMRCMEYGQDIYDDPELLDVDEKGREYIDTYTKQERASHLWRLPTRREFVSLVTPCKTDGISPGLMPLPADNPFVNVFGKGYWSSTLNRDNRDDVWCIEVGAIGTQFCCHEELDPWYIWPVKGEMKIVDFEGERFVVNGDEVFDKKTGLIWKLDASVGGKMFWKEAKEFCKKLNKEG